MLRAALLSLVFACASFATRAAAQELPEPTPTKLAPVEALQLSRDQLRRGTWLVAAGAVMTMSGGAMLHFGVEEGYCEERGRGHRVATTTGAVNLAVGIGLGLSSAFPLRRMRHSPRTPH